VETFENEWIDKIAVCVCECGRLVKTETIENADVIFDCFTVDSKRNEK